MGDEDLKLEKEEVQTRRRKGGKWDQGIQREVELEQEREEGDGY